MASASKPKAAAEKTIEVEFDWDKETKTTNRYQEPVADGERGIVGTIYVAKSALPRAKSISVTITTVGAEVD